jgi:hypothetical protein
LNEEQLKQLFNGQGVYSEPVYHNGHCIKRKVEQWKAEGAQVCSLWVGLQIHQPFFDNDHIAIVEVRAPEIRTHHPEWEFFFLTSCKGEGRSDRWMASSQSGSRSARWMSFEN